MKKFLEQFNALPKWVQWMPVVIVILSGLLIGAIIDLKNTKAAMSTTSSGVTEEWVSPAQGKISHKEARALYDQLKNPVWDTGIFYKKTFQERVSYMQEAKKLEEQLEVFGTPSQCRSAAISRSDYIRQLHYFANVGEGKEAIRNWEDVTAPMYNAFLFGDHVAGCYDEVAALDAK